MFSDLKAIVDIIRSGAQTAKSIAQAKEREATVLDLLRTYFIFKDCVEEGEKLITEAGPDPARTLRSVNNPEESQKLINRWDEALTRQNARLRYMHALVFDQDHLTVINPGLQEKIQEIIGYKGDTVVTLHRIGAGLFFRGMFPDDDPLEIAGYVNLIAGTDDEVLDMSKIRSDITALREALEEYRLTIRTLASDDEIVRLSKKARSDTQIKT